MNRRSVAGGRVATGRKSESGTEQETADIEKQDLRFLSPLQVGIMHYESEFFSQFLSEGVNVEHWAGQMIRSTNFVFSYPNEIDPVVITPSQLGFKKPALRQEIIARLPKILKLCPCDAAPHLRCVYHHQPERKLLTVFSRPILCHGDSAPRMFVLLRDGKRLYLCSRYVSNNHPIDCDELCMFCLRDRRNGEN